MWLISIVDVLLSGTCAADMLLTVVLQGFTFK